MINKMSGGAIKKLRRQKIKQQLKEQKADKTVNELKDKFTNPTEEELQELSEAIANIVLDEEKEEKDEETVD